MRTTDIATAPPLGRTHELTIREVFDYAKGPKFGPVEFPYTPTVFATYVDHEPHAHPDANNTSNLTRYASGALTLSADKKKLTGRMRMWRNINDAGTPAFFGSPATPPDAFDDPSSDRSITITLADSGAVSYQMQDVQQQPPATLNAAYVNSIFIETSGSGMRSLSFTLGKLQHEA